VLTADGYRLHDVPGVGPQTVHQVMEAARLAAIQIHHDTRFRFDPDRPDPGQTRLLATLAAIRAADGTAATLREPLQSFTARTAPLAAEAERATSRMRMFFAGRSTKNAALRALVRLDALLAEPSAQALQQTITQRESALDPRNYPPDQLWHAYRTDAASVNAVLSTVGERREADEGEAARGFIPEELHQQITAVPLDTRLLTATLRVTSCSGRSTRSTRSGQSSATRWGSARRCRRSPCSPTWLRGANVASSSSAPPACRSTG
jgi:hypothetical protein